MKGLKKIVLLLLIFVMILSFTACKAKNTDVTEQNTDVTYEEVFENGSTELVFEVVDLEGNAKYFLIKTDKTNVGDALLECELISGEDSVYGLYVKTVDGITLDYEKDGKYWAFYIDNEYALTGVDSTEVEVGKTYTFKAE